MKKGFTMIELIFVIVILGVLASVAIPRLAATRDDAEVAKAATNLATAISDISAYYTAQGSFGDFANMTSAVNSSGQLNVKGSNTCLTLRLEGGGKAVTGVAKSSDPAKITFQINGTDPVCKQLQKISGIKSMCGQTADLTSATTCTINVGGSGVDW